MYKFAVVDDDKKDLKSIEFEIVDYCNYHKLESSIDLYDNPNNFNIDENYDAIFLDIDMPELNGLQLAKTINENNPSKIIFVTNYDSFIHNVFNVHPFHFIKKKNLKIETIQVLNTLFKSINKEVFIIKTKEGIKKVKYSEIYYITVDNNLSTLHTYNKQYDLWETLSSLYEKVEVYYFKKINQSTIVNLSYIKRIDKNIITMTNNKELTISSRLKPLFIKEYKKYLLKEL